MKIQLRCGKRPREGWVNIDLENPLADVQADFTEWDNCEDGTVEHVLASDVIEHVNCLSGMDICAKVLRWLKPGGIFEVEMPDREKCIELAKGELSDQWDTGCVVGLSALLGGRENRSVWAKWLSQHREMIVAFASRMDMDDELDKLVPDYLNAPGGQHVYVWNEWEFRDYLVRIGFDCTSEVPKYHGARGFRDMRVVARKL